MIQAPIQVWVVDDDESIRWVLEQSLADAGMQSKGFGCAGDFIDALGSGTPNVVITDVRMPDADGLELLAQLQSKHPELPVIVMTAHSDLDIPQRQDSALSCISSSSCTVIEGLRQRHGLTALSNFTTLCSSQSLVVLSTCPVVIVDTIVLHMSQANL